MLQLIQILAFGCIKGGIEVTTKILSTIPDLSIASLSKSSLTDKVLCRANGSTLVDGYTTGQGFALGTSASAPPVFTQMDSYLIQGSIIHSSTSGAVDYTIPLLNGDGNPGLFFESVVTKTTSNTTASVIFFLGTSNGIDTGNNYATSGFYHSGTGTYSLVTSSGGPGFSIGDVYSNTASSPLRQAQSIGTGILSSGGQRIISVNANFANSVINGRCNFMAKWKNTADTVTSIMIRVPAEVDVIFNVYQRSV